MSANSSHQIVAIFHAMFPGKISDEMPLCAKKLMCLITDALHPYCKQILMKDIQSYLVLEYDETTSSAGMKELHIRVRYWFSYGTKSRADFYAQVLLATQQVMICVVRLFQPMSRISCYLKIHHAWK